MNGARLPWVLLATALAAGCATTPRRDHPMAKCVWVSRFEYETAADIDRIMRRCAQAGFRSVMFQVRGAGTCFYASRLEVWPARHGFQSPGFDPLSRAVLAAHDNRLELHAWINMLPGWDREEPPADQRQLLRAHPDWFLRGPDGELVKEGKYCFLNPCLPAVREYLARLCEEIASGYGIDGIHLDYIRFPHGEVSEQSPGDPVSRALFADETGRSVADVAAFREWKAAQVTGIVQRVRERLERLPRRVPLTAAVNANLDRIRKDVLQDWPTWSRRGYVDAVFPMNYTADHALFVRRCRECVEAAGWGKVVMGVGAYKHRESGLPVESTVRQMNAAVRFGAAGVCLFSYGSAFPPPGIGR